MEGAAVAIRIGNRTRALLIGGVLTVGIMGLLVAGMTYVSSIGRIPEKKPVKLGRSTSRLPEPEMTPSDLDQMAAERVVEAFYDALNHKNLLTARSQFTTAGAEAITSERFRKWQYTAFIWRRTVIETDTAEIFGGETRMALTTASSPALRFTLERVNKKWRIVKWNGVGLTALEGARPGSSASANRITLNPTKALDVASTLLKARMAGDKISLGVVTTAAFQSAHPQWFNGVSNASTFTTYTIGAVKFKEPAYVISVKETWSGKTAEYTYTVVQAPDAVLVDATTAP
jgi:hypothetical protein